MSEAHNVFKALSFFESAIKCGEAWTESCDGMQRFAVKSIDTLHDAQIQNDSLRALCKQLRDALHGLYDADSDNLAAYEAAIAVLKAYDDAMAAEGKEKV